MLKAGAVKDQRGVPNCTACAVVAAVEALNPGFIGSVSFVYHNIRPVDRREGGLTVWDALAGLHRFGVCSEASWPSIPSNDGLRPPIRAYREARRLRPRVIAPLNGVADSIKWLRRGKPLVISYRTSILVQMGLHRPDDQQGWHTSAIMGYNSTKKAFLVWNSWGLGWATDGTFWLPVSTFGDEDLCRGRFGVSL